MRRLSKFAFPIIASQLVAQLMALSDIWMMSRISVLTIAAGGLAATVFSFAYIVCKSMVMPAANQLSMAFGRHRLEGDRHCEIGLIIISAAIMALVLNAFVLPLCYVMDHALAAMGQPHNVIDEAMVYLHALKWSFLPMLLLIIVQNVPIASGFSRSVIASTSVLVVCNICLSYWFAFGLDWGLAGLGWGSSAAAWITVCGYGVWVFARQEYSVFSPWHYWRQWRVKQLSQLAKLSGGAALATITECSLLSAAALFAGTLGPVYLAAHQIILQVLTVSWNVAFGFSQATAMTIGSQLGKGESLINIRRSALSGLSFSTLATVLIGGVFLTWPELLSSMFVHSDLTDSDKLMAVLPGVMVVAASCFVVDAWQLMALNILRGFKIFLLPAVITIFGYIVVGIPAIYWLKLKWGLAGIWIGIGCGLAVTGCLLLGLLVLTFRNKARQSSAS